MGQLTHMPKGTDLEGKFENVEWRNTNYLKLLRIRK